MEVKARPLGKRRSYKVQQLTKLVAANGYLHEDYLCPWCGGRHTRWVGDHLVPLAGLLSPVIPAGENCNRIRLGVAASSNQIIRLFNPKVAVGTHSPQQIKSFLKEWSKLRYGSEKYIDLSIGDSGPSVPIRKRIDGRYVKDNYLQLVANRAYTSIDGLSEDDIRKLKTLPGMRKRRR